MIKAIEIMSEFDTNWKGTESERILSELWYASEYLCNKIQDCIQRARDLPEGFERTCLLNSASNHILSGIDLQRGGFAYLKQKIDEMRKEPLEEVEIGYRYIDL